MPKAFLVTGGTGFLGSALVRRLAQDGYQVRVLDNNSRGSSHHLEDIQDAFEFIEADIRDPEAVKRAVQGVDCVCHLASVNGTEFFYSHPDLVLDVGVKGIVNVLEACLKHEVGELILASSSEVYQFPSIIPTPEDIPLMIPDPFNPRYSYAAAKIISEMLVINYGRNHFERVVIFRPHNVYGPSMGWEHVVPQFVLRLKELCQEVADPIRFPIQSDGAETRSFVFIDDFIDGLIRIIEQGEHLGIYNIGTAEEMAIRDVAHLVAEYFGRRIEIVSGEPAKGGTMRRSPDISKLVTLGYQPKYSFREGLPIVARWYDQNAHKKPKQWDWFPNIVTRPKYLWVHSEQ